MEAMTPWLLLIIAALIVACVSLYFHLRQAESQSRGEQSIITDELREAEAALTSVLEKIQRMDRELAAREKALAEPVVASVHAAPSALAMEAPCAVEQSSSEPGGSSHPTEACAELPGTRPALTPGPSPKNC